MSNERITEDIVREHFKKDANFSNIVIEEQKSNNRKIDKLLKNASKNGNGDGRPEFIIQFNENSDLLIIVECKADIKKHISTSGDKYKDYAVDGVLLYSSFLSKEYDVLSIAVSGDKINLKISHFLQLKNSKTVNSIFNDDKLLSIEEYLSGYQTDERKFNQDFHKILLYSKKLNDKLHILKVEECDRSLLISGILIALTDKAFSSGYKFQDPTELANNLVTTIENKLAKVQNKNIVDLSSTYNFITTHTVLSKKDNVLKQIIAEVDGEINNFVKTYKYFDVLGQFYIEFLKYANNGKGLGIVLTPPHITELFADIAQINKDSVVLDNCTGTGGFLISSMNKMIKDANKDKEKETNIKKSQLFGIEFQHRIFSLACSNMFIHGDGRSNLIKGSCFDNDIIEHIIKYKPNVGFLNPPYKANKNDIEELQFVLNNLSMLQKDSLCVAIVPMSCALTSQEGNRLALKKELLKQNTLEAVFSVPDELFINSDVAAITCIIVFKAKEPHPQGYKTYFGYWKDDGFTKRKTNGRYDYHNNWEKIKQKWLLAYRNKEEISGLSTKREVAYTDEWCAEAYMKTDYENAISDKIFENELLKYSSFLFFNKEKLTVNEKNVATKSLQLKVSKWEEFKIGDLFNIFKGGDQADTDSEGYFPLISATRDNNGVSGVVVEGNRLFKKGTITVASNGASTGEAFYQPNDYYATGDVNVLEPKQSEYYSIYTALFIATVIRVEKYRFNYGRKWGKSRMEESIIKLPAKVDNKGKPIPDWQFMEDYIKSLPYSSNL